MDASVNNQTNCCTRIPAVRATKGERSTALSPEIEVPARTKISRCLRSYSCRRLQVLKFQHDSASDGSTLTISTLVHLRKNRTSHIKRIWIPRASPSRWTAGAHQPHSPAQMKSYWRFDTPRAFLGVLRL